ncbi:MAG: DNA ligase (NAD+), partial [Myxococcota bacterium]
MSNQTPLSLGGSAAPKTTSTAADIVKDLTRYNTAYRAGTPLITDKEYDDLTEKLRALDPDHEFLAAVEPEELSTGSTVRHARPMLSTEKSYTRDALERYV